MIFDPILDIFRGKAVTIPPLDGAFRPNTRLDETGIFATLPEADNLVVRRGELLATSGNAIYAITEGREPSVVETFPSPVSAIAVGKGNELAVALDNGNLLVDDRNVELPPGVRCITALAFGPDGALWLANGSAAHSPSGWVADLMEKGASGSVWKRDAGATVFREVARELAFPYGLLPRGEGVVVSESWRHRLVRLDGSGKRSTLVDHLPGYPSRLSLSSEGGAWLSVFAPRNRLIEFVLQETHYRHDMMASVPRQHWIAPALSSNRSFLEPLQCGSIKSMGVHKPWSPTRSYGMVVKLDTAMQPVSSLHSRANGTRHGTTSAVEVGGRLFVAAKGGDCIMSVGQEDAF